MVRNKFIPLKEFYDKKYITNEIGVQYLFSAFVPDNYYFII